MFSFNYPVFGSQFILVNFDLFSNLPSSVKHLIPVEYKSLWEKYNNTGTGHVLD